MSPIFVRSALLALALVNGAAGVAAQESAWTGFFIGVHGGIAEPKYSLQSSDAFCFTHTSATGDGVASASCEVGPSLVAAQTEVTTATATMEATGTADFGEDILQLGVDSEAFAQYSANVNGVPDFAPPIDAGAGAVGPGVATVNVNASQVQGGSEVSHVARIRADPVPATLEATGETRASGPSGSATAVAVALYNAIDLGESTRRADGLAGGAHTGYNRQFSNGLVVGVEGDFTFLPNSTVTDVSSDTFAGVQTVGVWRKVSMETDFIATARARLGLAQGKFLPYLTGGIAYASFDINSITKVTLNGVGYSSSNSVSEGAVGSVFGGGLLWKPGDNMVFSIEGLRYNFNDSFDIDGDDIGDRAKLHNAMEWRAKISFYLN